jgi:hypothetical protein
MYLMYVDESGDTGLVNSPTRYFVLSGIVIHESRWREFINALVAFRRTLKSVYGLPVRSEIHSSELINKNIFKIPKHDRLAILRNTLDEISKFDYISITNVVVNKAGKLGDYDVFDAAWGTLFQRFENTVSHGNFPGQHRQAFGIVFTDATAGQKLSMKIRKMAVHNPIPNDSRFAGGYRNMPITRIIEDPNPRDSRSSLPIQMADVVAYTLHQKLSPNSYFKRQRASQYFDRLDSVLNKKASRYDPHGIVAL